MPWSRLKKVALSLLLVFAAAAYSQAEDVILKPGYLSGRVSFGNNYQISSFNINAYGGGYTSTHSSITADYRLTVQGGPWDYRLVTSARFSGGNGTSYITFSDRYLQIGSGATVINDYVYNPGIVRFEVTITGDAYSSWSAHSWGEKAEAAGQGKTYTGMGTESFYADGAWEMPVVPNQQIKLTSTIHFDGPGYDDFSDLNFNFGYKDIAPGEVVTIPIHINYTSPPPKQPPPYNPPGPYYYGYLTGTIWAHNVPSEDFVWHMLLDSSRKAWLSDNPVNYSVAYWSYSLGTTFNPNLRPASWFKPGSTCGTLWPDSYIYKGPVTIGETRNKDFIIEDVGKLTGNFSLLGPVPIQDVNIGKLHLRGASQLTTGGIAYVPVATVGSTYKTYLSEGVWRFSGLDASKKVLDSSPYSTSLSVSYANQAEAEKDFGIISTPYIVPAETTVQNLTYCLGDVIYRFRDASGGYLSRPRINGTGKRYSAGQTVMTANVSSYSSAVMAQAPQVEIFGPPGAYSLSSEVTTGDGSLIRYPLMTKDLVCGVQEIIDIPGPTLRVTSPVSGTITNADSINVTGAVSSGSTVTGVTVNGQAAVLGTAGDPNAVTFSHSVVLAEGINTITTTAVDASEAQASASRILYVDRWQPQVTIKAPVDGDLFWSQESTIPIEVDAADRGYGHTLTLYLDGEAIYLAEESGDDTAPVSRSYSRIIGNLAVGEHVLMAEVVDRAGNRASTTVNITSYLDNWPPTVQISSPPSGSVFSGGDIAIPIALQAADQGSGFTLNVSLDGNPLSSLSGPANLLAPATVSVNNLVGPLSSGTHLLEAVVTDSAGNSASVSQSFQVDGWQPQVSIHSPAAGSLFAGVDGTIPLSVTASDQGYGFVLAVYLDGTLAYQTTGSANDVTPVEANINEILGPLSSGEHLIRAVATDAAGNQVVEETILYIDGWLPEITILAPGDSSYFASTNNAVPVNVQASDRGYGFTLDVYLDGNLLSSTNGGGNPTEAATVAYNTVTGPLVPGNHEILAVATDAAGNKVSRSVRIISYLAVTMTVKPEASHNAENGTSTIFVQLPQEIGETVSLLLADNREVTTDPIQFPYDVRLGDGKLILKFNRTPELMSDDFYTVEGRYYPNPLDQTEFYYWRGSDTTKW